MPRGWVRVCVIGLLLGSPQAAEAGFTDVSPGAERRVFAFSTLAQGLDSSTQSMSQGDLGPTFRETVFADAPVGANSATGNATQDSVAASGQALSGTGGVVADVTLVDDPLTFFAASSNASSTYGAFFEVTSAAMYQLTISFMTEATGASSAIAGLDLRDIGNAGPDIVLWNPIVQGGDDATLSMMFELMPGEEYSLLIDATVRLPSPGTNFGSGSASASWAFSFGQVPEPAVAALLGLGVVGLALSRVH